MIRRVFRLIVLAGVAAGVAAVVRALTTRDDPLPTPATTTGDAWPPLRNETAPPAPVEPTPRPGDSSPRATVAPEPEGVPVADGPASSATPWVEPDAGGTCPAGYPIKAKMKSKIFHAPGQLNYERTTPDRCYLDAPSAEADGLRAAKR